MYKFNPSDYNFVEVDSNLQEYTGSNTLLVKIATHGNIYWFLACKPNQYGEDRHHFISGMYDCDRNTYSGHDVYIGCITSRDFAEQLLVHLLGTTTNEGTMKYGLDRFNTLCLRYGLPQ